MVNQVVSATGELADTVEGDFIAAVADGMGGANAGGIASRMALDGLARIRLPVTDEELEGIIRELHHNILAYGSSHPEASGLGTTLTGIVCMNDKITVFNVGDSRVYRYRDGILKQLTKDHSLVQALYDSGRISREEMFYHPQKNIVLQSLGGTTTEDRIQVDVETIRGLFEPNDILLLCSDGLSDMLREEEIEEILLSNMVINDAAQSLVARLNEHGGHDNITVVIAVRK
jgi:protein phosphatase